MSGNKCLVHWPYYQMIIYTTETKFNRCLSGSSRPDSPFLPNRLHNNSTAQQSQNVICLSPVQTALDGLITAKKLKNLLEVVVRGNYW